MANIILALPMGELPYDGKQITFRAPCDCTVPEGIVIDGQKFTVVDAVGNVMTGSIGTFMEGAMVSVILDVTNSKAYIQNAASIINNNISNIYSSDKAYKCGDYCIHNNTLQKCTVDIPTGEEWNPEHWEATNITDELKMANSNRFTIEIGDEEPEEGPILWFDTGRIKNGDVIIAPVDLGEITEATVLMTSINDSDYSVTNSPEHATSDDEYIFMLN